MTPAILDTSVYISVLRRGRDAAHWLGKLTEDVPLWLSAVVLEELYAGAKARDHGVIARLERDYAKVDRILVPNVEDWVETGKVLAQVGLRYGYEQIGRGRLTNDALLGMSAARCGFTVLTRNERDFARLAEFRPFRYEVVAGLWPFLEP